MDSMSRGSFLFQGLLIFDRKLNGFAISCVSPNLKLSNLVEIIAFQHCHMTLKHFSYRRPNYQPKFKETLSLQDQNSLYWKSCVCVMSHLCSLDSLFLVLLLTLLVQSRSMPTPESNCTDLKNRAQGIARSLLKEAGELRGNYVSTRLVIFSQAESVFLSYRLQSVTTLGLNVSVKCVPCLHCECYSYWKTLTAPTALTF